jgi:hypothetical protein
MDMKAAWPGFFRGVAFIRLYWYGHFFGQFLAKNRLENSITRNRG